MSFSPLHYGHKRHVKRAGGPVPLSSASVRLPMCMWCYFFCDIRANAVIREAGFLARKARAHLSTHCY
eukprot:4827816-Pyramimonas_sp.AAC.1